jgi:hypothetical protein
MVQQHPARGALGARHGQRAGPARCRYCAAGSGPAAPKWDGQRQRGQDQALPGPGLMTGIQPRRKDTTWISMMPSQKTGTETKTEGRAAAAHARPGQGGWRPAASPGPAACRGKPQAARRSVGGRLVASPGSRARRPAASSRNGP